MGRIERRTDHRKTPCGSPASFTRHPDVIGESHAAITPSDSQHRQRNSSPNSTTVAPFSSSRAIPQPGGSTFHALIEVVWVERLGRHHVIRAVTAGRLEDGDFTAEIIELSGQVGVGAVQLAIRGQKFLVLGF